MINIKQLSRFLIKAHKSGYATEKKVTIKEKDKSKTIIHKDGDWEYHDNYFGGEPYGGREVIFYKKKPIYMMVYYGYVDKSIINFKKVYKFLREALSLIPKDKPFRGPKEYKKSNFTYKNKIKGKIDNFTGEEFIYFKNKEIYKTTYAGGLIDKRKY